MISSYVVAGFVFLFLFNFIIMSKPKSIKVDKKSANIAAPSMLTEQCWEGVVQFEWGIFICIPLCQQHNIRISKGRQRYLSCISNCISLTSFLYPGLKWASGALQRTVQGVAAVLFSLQVLPSIRYQNNSEMARVLSENIRVWHLFPYHIAHLLQY